jgi:hypothetical protein
MIGVAVMWVPIQTIYKERPFLSVPFNCLAKPLPLGKKAGINKAALMSPIRSTT